MDVQLEARRQRLRLTAGSIQAGPPCWKIERQEVVIALHFIVNIAIVTEPKHSCCSLERTEEDQRS